MFAAILLSQLNSCPGITRVTDDVITTADDVIHMICIDFFRTENSPLQLLFLELHMEILMQQLLNNNQNICCWSKFLSVKNYFIK